MADQIKERSIIAMKGAPFTRKTQYANLIASALSCPMFSVENFLDFLGPDQRQIFLSGDLELKADESPEEVGLMIINQMAASHLLNQVVDNVVIDSLLSSESQLESLVRLVSLCPNTRLVVVECKPKDLDLWKKYFESRQRRIEERSPRSPAWYKAKSWEEIKEAIIKDEYDLDGSMYNGSVYVSKLVLDPLEDYLRIYGVKRYDDNEPKPKPPPFMDAIEHMIRRGEGPGVVVYQEWRKSHPRRHSLTTKKMEMENPLCSVQGHEFMNYEEELELLGVEEDIKEEVKCPVCEKEVKSVAYSCINCRLVAHKECFERIAMEDYDFDS